MSDTNDEMDKTLKSDSSSSEVTPPSERWWGDERGLKLLSDLKDRRSIAVVGARDADATGLLWTSRVVTEALTRDVIIISGGARGVDERAHRSALEGGGESVAILGCGLNHISARHRALSRQGIGLLSPFPDHTSARRWTFPRRNNCIADLADQIIVAQASEKSGSLSTARAALRQEKPVWVLTHLPDAPLHRGCLTLLREGARPLTSARCWLDLERAPPSSQATRRSQVLPHAPVTSSPPKIDSALSSPELPSTDSALWRASSSTPRSLSHLALAAEIAWPDALTEATLLEMSGWLEPVLGGLYIKAYGQGSTSE